MAKYMLLIFGETEQWNAMTPAQSDAHMAAHGTFAATAGSALVDGAQLEAESTATTLPSDGSGGISVTDGRFLETKEALGGYYVIEASDLDGAIKAASMLPEAQHSRQRGGDPAGGGPRLISRARWSRRSRKRTAATGPRRSPPPPCSPTTSTWPRSARRTPTSRLCASCPTDGIPDRPGAGSPRRRGTGPGTCCAGSPRSAGRCRCWSRSRPSRGPRPGSSIDGRLRLIFTCCHPALSGDAQIALTLRLVCGLSTAEVARAFLVREPTMAARITRAKKKISAARGSPTGCRPPDQLDERVSAVLEVVHLIFTTGHTAPEGPRLARRDLVDSAISLARLLHLLMPTQADISALLALLLLIDARAQTRGVRDGRLLLLSEQDRTALGPAARSARAPGC